LQKFTAPKPAAPERGLLPEEKMKKFNRKQVIKELNDAESTGACFWRRFKKSNGKEVANVFVRWQKETGAQWANANSIQKHFGARALEEIQIDRLSGCLIIEVNL